MSMVGRHKGFIAHLKKLCTEILVVHCMLHRHQLVATNISPELNHALNVVSKTINKSKSNSKFNHLFENFVSILMSSMLDFYCIPMSIGGLRATAWKGLYIYLTP